MITAELHDGRKLEFPDGTDPAVIQRVVKQTLGVAEQRAELMDIPRAFVQQTKDALGGFVRGAGSIGSTLMAPNDALEQALYKRKGVDVGDLNQQRRQGITDATQTLGADPESLTYGAGKLGAEIAGTAAMGNVLAGLAKATPIAARIPNVIEAVSTAGMRGGGIVPRAVGGAVTGGAAAGLVNPDDAGAGALIGGALPVAVKAGGAVGQAAGKVLRGPEQSTEVQAAINAARESGYVIPPSQARPTLGNRMLEGLSGKITTAQNASAKNQAVTNRLAAEAIGLPGDTPLTVEVLDKVRKQAGQAYEELRRLPIKPATQANTLTNTSAAPEINPSKMVFDLRKARNDATAWFRSYGRTADPDALAKAQAAAAKAKQLETTLEDYATGLGRDDLVSAMQEARTRIAKTYSIEDALNAVSGSVDARRLAKQLDKGKPLSGELKQAAEFAARFPKAAQAVEGMGSLPQTSPLDWAMGGGLAMGTGNPLMLASMAARPAARSLVLSPVVQNRLVQQQSNALSALLNPDLAQFGYRAAPIVAGPSANR
jgi:hypothetical protein